MKFRITRTSLWAGEQPIPEATEKFPGSPDSPYKPWIIAVHTLADLLALVSKYGDIIVRKELNLDEYALEVYDDYRE